MKKKNRKITLVSGIGITLSSVISIQALQETSSVVENNVEHGKVIKITVRKKLSFQDIKNKLLNSKSLDSNGKFIFKDKQGNQWQIALGPLQEKKVNQSNWNDADSSSNITRGSHGTILQDRGWKYVNNGWWRPFAGKKTWFH